MPVNMHAGLTSHNHKTFRVVFETRQDGAIGEFQHSATEVTMHQSSFSDADVYRAASEHFRRLGLETRFPVLKEEIRAQSAT